MPVKRNPKRAAHKSGGLSRSTLALIAIWTVAAIAVAVSHTRRPPAAIALEVQASTMGFTLSGSSPQLLLGTTSVQSLTIAGFKALSPGPDTATSSPARAVSPGDAGASLTVRPASLEAISAGPQARISINKLPDEPTTRITITDRPGTGTVRAPSDATLSCYRCGDPESWSWLMPAGVAGRAPTSFVWTGNADGGGTDVLLLPQNETLVVSRDDLRIEGAVDLREAGGEELVSTIDEGTIRFLATGGTRDLGKGARLIVEGIEPGTGLLKDLTVTPQGVSASIEARVSTLSIEEAGEMTSLLPSYLEIGFQNQRWLLLVQGIVLVGGTVTKLVTWLRSSAGKE